MDKFKEFLDLDLVDDDDVKMRLFMLILSGEVKKWFKDLPSGSIRMFAAF